MNVDIDVGRVIDKGRYIPLINGDVIVVDAKTVPMILKSVGQKYTTFVPTGYERFSEK